MLRVALLGFVAGSSPSRTPRRPPARIALEARAVADQREIPALSAGLALVALGLGLGALFGGEGSRLGAGFGLCGRPWQIFQRFGRGGSALEIERGGAFHVAMSAGG